MEENGLMATRIIRNDCFKICSVSFSFVYHNSTLSTLLGILTNYYTIKNFLLGMFKM